MILTKEKMRELLLTILIGTYVRSGVADAEGKDFKYIEKIEEDFVLLANKLGYDDLVDDFEGKLIPSNKLCLESDKIMEDFNEDEFWNTLEVYLGQRDFYRELNPEEKKRLNSKKWLPDEIEKYYEKYREEFEKHGVDRIEIISKKKK